MVLPQWNPIAFFNVPGSIHESQIADWGNVFIKLEEVYNNNGDICVVDFAFGKVRRPYLTESCQDPHSSKKPHIQKQLTRYS